MHALLILLVFSADRRTITCRMSPFYERSVTAM